jgi:hypothetical protein
MNGITVTAHTSPMKDQDQHISARRYYEMPAGQPSRPHFLAVNNHRLLFVCGRFEDLVDQIKNPLRNIE